MRSSLPIMLTKIVNILMSVCLCAFGITVVAMPNMPYTVMRIVTGVLLILLGAFKLAGYFSKDLFRLAFQYDLQLGVILAVLGAAVLIKTDETVSFVCVIFGAAVFVDGAFKTAIAFDAKKFGVKPWLVILLSAIVACVLTAALIICPQNNVKALTILLGASLIAEGILHLIVILSTVKIINHQLPDNMSDTDN